MRALPLLLGLALLAPVAYADVVLIGAQHIGDNDSGTGDAGAVLEPGDPVTRRQHFQSPTNFRLSSNIMVTAIQFDGLTGTVDPAKLKVRINGSTTPLSGTFSGNTLTLSLPSLPLLLAANRDNTIAIDPGCSGTTPSIGSECSTGTGNDIGFSAITLKSTGTTTTTNLVRRRHVGRNTSETNNYGGSFYPDMPDCDQALPAVCAITITFTLMVPQRLTQLRFFRVRNVDTRSGAVPAQVVLDGTIVGALNQNRSALAINTNFILNAGNHELIIRAGTDRNGAPDDISWDEISLLYTFDSSLVPGAFNAVDPSEADVVSGRLRTKIAGFPFNVDLIALNATRDAEQLGYSGTVRLALLDASNDGGLLDSITSCRNSWSFVQDLGDFTFSTGTGRQPVTGLIYGNALRAARLRMTQSDGAIVGCSTDAFSIRPEFFDFAISGPAVAASYASNSTPTYRAGRPFTVRATALLAGGASPATNYDGQPTLVAQTSLLGATLGVVSADNWSVAGGIAQSDSARYSEVGAVTMRGTDTQYAAVDVDDTSLAERTIAGQINAGRFIPDHFTFTSVRAEFTPGCVNFTYAGQPIPFSIGKTPIGRITAESFGGATTENYDSGSGLYRLPASLPQSTYTLYDDPAIAGTPLIDLTTIPADDNDVVEIGAGIAEVRLTTAGLAVMRPAAPALPFTAEVQITLGALGEPDGVNFDPATPGRFGEAAAGNGVPFLGGTSVKQVRFGRLAVDNAHGSERLPLNVPLRVEYWASVPGGTGFITSSGDTCTALAPGDIALTDNPVGTTVTAVGGGNITLSAPNATGYATVSPNLSSLLLPWLRGDWDGDGDWSEDGNDPSGRATFGVHKTEERRIFQREVIGN